MNGKFMLIIKNFKFSLLRMTPNSKWKTSRQGKRKTGRKEIALFFSTFTAPLFLLLSQGPYVFAFHGAPQIVCLALMSPHSMWLVCVSGKWGEMSKGLCVQVGLEMKFMSLAPRTKSLMRHSPCKSVLRPCSSPILDVWSSQRDLKEARTSSRLHEKRFCSYDINRGHLH